MVLACLVDSAAILLASVFICPLPIIAVCVLYMLSVTQALLVRAVLPPTKSGVWVALSQFLHRGWARQLRLDHAGSLICYERI